MVRSLFQEGTGGRNWSDTVERSMWTGGDNRGAGAEDRMVPKETR